MKNAVIFLVLFSAALFAQTEYSREENPAGFLPKFYYDAFNYKGTVTGKTRVDIYVQMPYQGIQFIKTEDGFAGEYSVTLTIYDEKKEKTIIEKSWNETIKVKDFPSTRVKSSYYLSMRSLDLEPANYVIRCEVADKDSKRNFVKDDKFTVRSFNKPLDVSDVMFLDKEIISEGAKRILPNIGRNVAIQKDGIQFISEIYSDTSRNIILNCTILDSKKNEIYKKEFSRAVVKGINKINVKLENQELPIGIYDFILQVKSPEGTLLAITVKQCISQWVGMPTSEKDLDKAIDQLLYIAKTDELDKIKDAATYEEKTNLYQGFWKSKDPVPSTPENEVFEEYYRRIAYANLHFKHYREGWRTDMGMVYITLGPPSNVERHPFEYDSKPYEVWEFYDLNRYFLFVDETGFGDYRLMNRDYGSWFRYRQ